MQLNLDIETLKAQELKGELEIKRITTKRRWPKQYAQVLIFMKTAAGADLGIGENQAIFLNQISSGGPDGCSCPLKIVCRSNRNQP
jgi:hypothetical protein